MRLLPAIVLAALALAGCGSDNTDEAGSSLPATTEAVTEPATTETETETTVTETEPEGECSTSGVRLTLPEQDLPAAVADVRKRVFDAAIACDYDTLEQIALEKGAGFTFSYGATSDASEYWRKLEEDSSQQPKPMRALATILTLPFTRNESGSYAWPTAYNENPTEEAWRDLVYAGLYTAEQVDQMKTQGTGYLGYRTAITADGDWQFLRSPRRLEVLHEPGAVAALAVLDAAPAAGPVLPDDPLQVLELERDQRDAPEQDLSVVHPSRLSANTLSTQWAVRPGGFGGTAQPLSRQPS